MPDLRISELAASSGVPATTLRYYETEGILPAERSANGYRVYTERAQERLAFITAAKALQMSLPEIKLLLRVWETDTCRAVKSELRPAIAQQIANAEASIARLTSLHQALTSALARLDDTPDKDSACSPECAWLTTPAENAAS
ncbi:MerR family transcriptional regulator [Williamsia sp. 1135]|jgi:DNA-binding transcriptional MerR regulator|uniref:MerR family transcriptional regulator n=1 Tax=Williamsia sp. 1135 TaxID=1889262 RepID=UPI000A10989E|nr:MerR family transcriptional regulator [Williamsia sp. 1135]ORM37214.1 MerR family transcriptional regulator [Williamsia sp. 1135]